MPVEACCEAEPAVEGSMGRNTGNTGNTTNREILCVGVQTI
jgi:hypothetical protein